MNRNFKKYTQNHNRNEKNYDISYRHQYFAACLAAGPAFTASQGNASTYTKAYCVGRWARKGK